MKFTKVVKAEDNFTVTLVARKILSKLADAREIITSIVEQEDRLDELLGEDQNPIGGKIRFDIVKFLDDKTSEYNKLLQKYLK